MNEKFKELRQRAFDLVDNELETVGSDHVVMHREHLDMVNQKFAELIVKECAEVSLESSHREDDMGAIIARAIKQHFGFEE